MTHRSKVVATRPCLPIYGESRSDRMKRELRHDPSFGTWLVETLEVDEDGDELGYPDIVALLDSVIPLEGHSIEDFFLVLVEIAAGQQEMLEFRDASEVFVLGRLSEAGLLGEGAGEHVCLMPRLVHLAPETGGIYFIQQGPGGPIKIGSASNIRKRMKSLQTGSPVALVFLGHIDGTASTEHEIHRLLRRYSLMGEWFRPDQEVLQYLRDNGTMRPHGADELMRSGGIS